MRPIEFVKAFQVTASVRWLLLDHMEKNENILFNLKSEFLALPITERIFAMMAFLFSLFLTIFNSDFVKLGIPVPLPSGLGALPGQEVKIFAMECFIFLSGCVFAWHALHFRAHRGLNWKNPVWIVAFVVLLAGCLRIVFDLRQNPVLVIRNSCFVWYLFLPLAAYHAGISLNMFRWLGKAIAYSLVVLFFLGTFNDFFFRAHPGISWFIPYGGIVGFVLLVFLGSSTRLFWLAMPPLSLAAGATVFFQINRTTLLAQILAFFIVFALLRHRKEKAKRLFLRMVPFLLLTALSTKAWELRFNLPNIFVPVMHGTGETPGGGGLPVPVRINLQSHIFHSEAKNGMEAFRWELWTDALGLFLESPLTGIGFEKQVVYRIPMGGDTFRKNVVTPWGPPVSGPHNSYLNALARLGIVGSLVALLHLMVLWIFWKSQELEIFWLYFGQVIYALFNVGLEGPLRSFVAVVFLGMGLLLAPQYSVSIWGLRLKKEGKMGGAPAAVS